MKKLFLPIFLCLAVSIAALADGYTRLNNLSYKNSPDKDIYVVGRCILDAYYPSGELDVPIVVWFHGGGLTGGEKEIPAPLMNKGLAVVGVNYRLMPGVTIDQCIDDAAAAVAFVMRHADDFNASPKKVIVAGHSAGGYLAAMIALDKKWLAKYDADPDSLAAVVPFSGQMITHFAHRDMNGIPNLQPTVDEYAPLYHVRGDAPYMVLITGDRERELFGRYEENAYMQRMMKLCGAKDTPLFELDGFDHGEMALPAFHILLSTIKGLDACKDNAK